MEPSLLLTQVYVALLIEILGLEVSVLIPKSAPVSGPGQTLFP